MRFQKARNSDNDSAVGDARCRVKEINDLNGGGKSMGEKQNIRDCTLVYDNDSLNRYVFIHIKKNVPFTET